MANFSGDLGFSAIMRPKAEAIYQRLFPGCTVKDLRPDNEKGAHELDQYFGIDTLIVLPTGGTLTVQEKYRRNAFLHERRYRVNTSEPDFTQEYMNAYGTEHEAPGEWFHLNADLYFYGWADAKCYGFERWVMLDVLRYKLLIESMGGLDKVGRRQFNKNHGRAVFYAIPIMSLKPAFLFTGQDVHDIKVWRTDDSGQVVYSKHTGNTGSPIFSTPQF